MSFQIIPRKCKVKEGVCNPLVIIFFFIDTRSPECTPTDILKLKRHLSKFISNQCALTNTMYNREVNSMPDIPAAIFQDASMIPQSFLHTVWHCMLMPDKKKKVLTLLYIYAKFQTRILPPKLHCARSLDICTLFATKHS